MCNVSLKETLVQKLNYIELAVAWSLSVGFGLTMAVILGGPAYLNPGVVLGNLFFNGLALREATLYLLMEFLAAGVAVILCIIFFWDSFKTSEGMPKKGIFAAYPVKKNLVLNFVQEVLATFLFLFLVLCSIRACSGDSAALQIGLIGFAGVMILSLTLNSTGFSMNAMRSVFSSVWFSILPIPCKGEEKVDWGYQLFVNLLGSSLGGVLAVFILNCI